MDGQVTKILITTLLSIMVFSLYGQREKIKFYYTISNTVYEGSFMVSHKVYDGSKEYKANGMIDYDEYDASNVKILAEVSNLRWQYASHGNDYRLAFVSEMLEAAEGLSLNTKFTQYLIPGSSRKIYYSPNADITETTPTGLVISCLVIKNDFNPDTGDDAIEEALTNGDFIGLAMTIKPLILIPKSEISSDEELAFLWELYEAIIKGADDELVNLSYRIAEVIQEGSYDAASEYFKNPPSANVDVFDGATATKKRDPDQEAFVAASREDNIQAYQNYLNRFPNGSYTKTARNKIVNLTPFEYNQTRNGSKFLITFTAGVGSSHPALTLTDNDDYVIKHNWINTKQVEIDIPEERSTKTIFTLGAKELKLDLENTFAPVAADISISGEQLILTNVTGGKAPYHVLFDQEGKKVYSAEINNTQSQTIDLSQIPLRKGNYTAKVLDIREETGASYDGTWERNNAGTAVSRSSRRSGSSKESSDKSWFLLIPIIGGTLFLLYRRYANVI